MNINKVLKPNKDIVIELDNEVEYIVNDKAIQAIGNDDKEIIIERLIDGKIFKVSLETIKKSLEKNGVIDYLDKRK